MNRTEYMQELHRRLKRLPAEDYENAMQYYNEYFNDAGVENEQKVMETLGDPQKVAAQILSDYAIKNVEQSPRSAKKGLSALWIVILSMVALPVGLPLALTGILVSLTLVVCIVLCYLIIFLVGVFLVFCGIVGIVIAFCVVAENLATTMLFGGISLVCAGIGILVVMAMIALCKKTFGAMAKFYYRHMNRQKEGNYYEERI